MEHENRILTVELLKLENVIGDISSNVTYSSKGVEYCISLYMQSKKRINIKTEPSVSLIPVKKEEDENINHMNIAEHEDCTEFSADGDLPSTSISVNAHNKYYNSRSKTSQAGKDTNKMSLLVRHKQDQGLKTFAWKECMKLFSHQSLLRHHVNAVHKGLIPFECIECTEVFSSMHLLRRHIETVHDRLKMYLCNECNRKFATFSHLRDHIEALHLKIKTRCCRICDRKFFSVKNLRVHVKAVHLNI